MVPSPWLLVALIAWWAWRYATVQSLPTFDEAEGALLAPLGFVSDAALLYGLFGLFRWRAAHQELVHERAASRLPAELAALAMLLSALLRALDAMHAHLSGNHLTVRFWRAFGEHFGDWALGMHTLLIAAAVTAIVGRFALLRHAAQGSAILRRLGGPHPRSWLQSQLRAALVVGALGLVAVGVGGMEANGTAVLPELRALLTLFQALGQPS